MLSMTITKDGLAIKADPTAQITLQEDAGCYLERENLIYAEHNWAVPTNDWAYFTADELGQLSEAPVFINMSSSDVEILESVPRFNLKSGDMFYFGDYMITDFTQALSRGETVIFKSAKVR